MSPPPSRAIDASLVIPIGGYAGTAVNIYWARRSQRSAKEIADRELYSWKTNRSVVAGNSWTTVLRQSYAIHEFPSLLCHVSEHASFLLFVSRVFRRHGKAGKRAKLGWLDVVRLLALRKLYVRLYTARARHQVRDDSFKHFQLPTLYPTEIPKHGSVLWYKA